jgi:hypothetical protein
LLTLKQVVIEVGGDEMLSVPDAIEMTKSANARRMAERADIRQKKKTVDRSYTLAVLKLMRRDWLLLAFGVIGAIIAGAVCHQIFYSNSLTSCLDVSSVCLPSVT